VVETFAQSLENDLGVKLMTRPYGTITVALVGALVWMLPSKSAAADARFDKIVDDYFAARFKFRPSEGTAAGLHEYDQKLEDLSRASVARRIDELLALQQRFAALKSQSEGLGPKLPRDDVFDLAFVEGTIDAELLELKVIRAWENNPMSYAMLPGNAIDLLIKRDFAPAVDRLRAVVAREKAIPALFEAARQNLKDAPPEFTELALRMARGSSGFFEKSVADWARAAAEANQELLADFQQSNAGVIDAVRKFAAWLETDLKPRSTGRYALGEDLFLAKLKAEELVEISLQDLLARGEANLEKDYRAFVETARRIDPTKTPAQVAKSLSDDHPSASDLVPSVRRSVEAARQFLIDRGIVTVPSEVRPKIEETPPYARYGSFASMDTPGPYETRATEAFYYVTPVEKSWDAQHVEQHLRLYNRPFVALINVHEAFPGHYLQFLYAGRFPTKTRKLLQCGTNAEGWAHYCEQMMVDEGFGNGDLKIRLAQLLGALLRDCRYLVGIKLHTAGWTVQQGAKLFQEKGFQEPANALEEARRGTFHPTYLMYTFGKLEIQKLRDDFRTRKGGSLRDFHDAFVTQGSLPLVLVRKILLGE
jgi:uncharacterized protein (DUF885 family)